MTLPPVTNWNELGGENKDILVVARKGKVSGVGLLARQTTWLLLSWIRQT